MSISWKSINNYRRFIVEVHYASIRMVCEITDLKALGKWEVVTLIRFISCCKYFTCGILHFRGLYHQIFFFFLIFIWQLGIGIRAIEQGHLPPINFMLVAMGNTLALLIGWRILVSIIFSNEKTNKNDDYRRGSPFELFEVCFPLLYQALWTLKPMNFFQCLFWFNFLWSL